jgi:hypothetical protein
MVEGGDGSSVVSCCGSDGQVHHCQRVPGSLW